MVKIAPNSKKALRARVQKKTKAGAQQQVASFLLDACRNEAGIKSQNIKAKDIAKKLGLGISTVEKSISDMKKAGLIQTDRHSVFGCAFEFIRHKSPEEIRQEKIKNWRPQRRY